MSKNIKTLELLAPAKNLECGIAAIDHGADAVYIGASRFGARAAVGNSLDDIERLCAYAHQFGAKVHVTVNTIIYDNELEDTLHMIEQLDQIGVDALLLQDMGVLREVKERNLWSRELHASTQCDTRTPQKASWLASLGFDRVVLARELSASEVKAVHDQNPHLPLEVFVHGALCVSYSGVCYASEKCFHRSANRGECAQFCRMKFNLLDANGREIEHQRHLLSLRDLCQIEHLDELIEAGASSFKIEGRLKDASYVKNVVAAYSKKLNDFVRKHPDAYRRASWGTADYTFEPNLKKTFNRGFTTYFLNGRQPDIASFDTPKAMGEYVGKVKEIRGKVSFNVASLASFANGDGLCFINDDRELEGFRVNKVQGNRLFPLRMPDNLRPGMALYRNNDQAFENILSKKSAERKISLGMEMSPWVADNASGVLKGVQVKAFAVLGNGNKTLLTTISKELPLEPAKRSQHDNMMAQLSKLGETIFVCKEVNLLGGIENYFIPNSVLTSLRREVMESVSENIAKLLAASVTKGKKPVQQVASSVQLAWQPEYAHHSYLYNIANQSALHFYEDQGMAHPAKALELGNHSGNLIMQCRHCIRFALGYCVKRGGKKPFWKEPLQLELGDGRKFNLEFVCKDCHMNVYSEE